MVKMEKTDTKTSNLNKLLDVITNMPYNDKQFIGEGSISEIIITDDYRDIKINKMELDLNSRYSSLTDLHFLVSVDNGKKYEPVLYFTKKQYINEELLERKKPALDLIDKNSLPKAFSDAIENYYNLRSTESKVEIGYIKKGGWAQSIMKFAGVKEEELEGFQEMFDHWKDKGEV